MYLIDNGEISLYSGVLPDHLSFDQFGIDWIVIKADSIDDAWEQVLKLESGKHPKQAYLEDLCTKVRLGHSFEDFLPSGAFGVTLKLEAIGDDARQFYRDISGNEILKETLFGGGKNPFRRPWVAEITGEDPKYKFKRVFLKGRKDYSEAADKKGSRGVYYYYVLDPGKIYEINDLVSLKSTKRYFARVLAGEIIEMTEDEVKECLSEALE